ncbi:Na(+)/H(+) exchange regulatory cofactor NHE-RF1 [Drosophila albomicans]|uniref:Na(+)/H(+) exchange regulatory cofactor NHE-RF1 n=1 Tax=Drosophila albomicans TaxID=7291 RepID=A0A6P8WKV5_DROAB|nr:Na(+)/H(+) exchange regulatory cofactor NHE-RF1 [Drosophila albomicans]
MSTQNTPKMPTPPTLPPGVTKTCHIVKRTDFDGYGFNLHSEKVKPGQFIGKVDANSPAEAAGLKEGDRILEVNGVSIGSETHKQVVARIKAISNEVRLLLIDVDGKAIDIKSDTTSASACASASASASPSASPAASPTLNGNGSNGNSPPSYEGTKQELPGVSANISSISVVSTKRVSNASSIQSGSTMNASDMDVVDRATPVTPPAVAAPISATQNGNKSPPAVIGDNNNLMMSTPPPPSATVANMNNNGNIYNSSNINSNSHNSPTNPTSSITNGSTNANGNISNSNSTNNSSATPLTTATNTGTNRAGSLNLPLTVAEMRAKLASKKKYDPKNESVDLKKKFDIIQKL